MVMEELKEQLLCGSTEGTLSLVSQECGTKSGSTLCGPKPGGGAWGENDVIVVDAH